MDFLYETHLHTNQSSGCGHSKGSEYIGIYKDLGFSGFFVTDHFFRGNTATDRNLPWREWVNGFCKGYEDALNEGIKKGFDVFFGWEETYDGDDYLVYGLDKNWLYEHPEVRYWTRGQQYEAVKEAGGAVVQAHPFRQHSYINTVHLSTGCVDGVEAANLGNEDRSYDPLAMRYGSRFGFAITAGSDTHSVSAVQNSGTYGIYLKEKLDSAAAYAKIIREKRIDGLKMPADRCQLDGSESVLLPVVIRDRDDKPSGNNWRALLGL